MFIKKVSLVFFVTCKVYANGLQIKNARTKKGLKVLMFFFRHFLFILNIKPTFFKLILR